MWRACAQVECGHVAVDRLRQGLPPVDTFGQGSPGAVDIGQYPAPCSCKRAAEVGLDASQAVLLRNGGQWVLSEMLQPCSAFIRLYAAQVDRMRAATCSPPCLQHSAIDTLRPQALCCSQACTARADHDHPARAGTQGCLGGTQPVIPGAMSHCRGAGVTGFPGDDQTLMQHLAQVTSMLRRPSRQQRAVGTEAERVCTPVSDMPRDWSMHALLHRGGLSCTRISVHNF